MEKCILSILDAGIFIIMEQVSIMMRIETEAAVEASANEIRAQLLYLLWMANQKQKTSQPGGGVLLNILSLSLLYTLPEVNTRVTDSPCQT